MPFDFEALGELVDATRPPPARIAEIHGLGCGILAAGFRPDFEHLARYIAEYTGDEAPTDPALQTFFEHSLASLETDDFEFRPCLPNDDDYPLIDRAESLSGWCQGFLYGFAAVQGALSSEAKELLHDLTEISQLDSAALDSQGLNDEEMEENERYYAELGEFVRMAVISLFMDNNASGKFMETDKHVRH